MYFMSGFPVLSIHTLCICAVYTLQTINSPYYSIVVDVVNLQPWPNTSKQEGKDRRENHASSEHVTFIYSKNKQKI